MTNLEAAEGNFSHYRKLSQNDLCQSEWAKLERSDIIEDLEFEDVDPDAEFEE